MKFKALWKDTFREINKSKMRFLAILMIIFLGVAFYVGISATGPDMINTSDEYYTDLELMDYRVQSTYGLTQEDIDSLENLDNMSVQGHYAHDFLLDDASTIRLYSLNPKNDQKINQYHIVDGRLPETNGEIAIDHKRQLQEGTKIGDIITLDTGESADEPDENLKRKSFEVVGLVNSPLFIEITSRGVSSVGSGTLNSFGVISEDDYTTDIFTEAYLKINGSENYKAYSDEYEEAVDNHLPELEHTLESLEDRRDENIQDEIQTELDDGWADIEEAEQELEDAEAELNDAQVEIEEGWEELEEGKKELERETASGRNKIEENEQKLRDGALELEENKKELIQQKLNLENEQSNLARNEKELLDGISQIEEGIPQIKEGIKEIDSNLPEVKAGIEEIETNQTKYQEQKQELEKIQAQTTQINGALKELQEPKANLENKIKELTKNKEDLENTLEQNDSDTEKIEEELAIINSTLEKLSKEKQKTENSIEELKTNRTMIEQGLNNQGIQIDEIPEQINNIDNGLNQLTAEKKKLEGTISQKTELENQLADLEKQLADLQNKKQELINGKNQLTDGLAQINDGLAQIETKDEEIQTGFNEIEKAKNTLAEETNNAQKELDDAESELNDAEVDYQEGLETFKKERKDAIVEIEDGKEELKETEADLENLAKPEYQSFDRTDNFGYSEYKDNADRLSVIAKVFPVLFFLIAIFISFTTMTRMVDEERGYIGIMKAMGYKNRYILIKFIVYAAIATVVGASLGLFVGYTLFPNLIFFAYSSLYNFPEVILQQYTLYTVIALAFAFVSTVGASLLAVRHSLQSNAAQLLQPKPPKKGSRIWLEKIGFIWNRLSFNYKITFRNVFRYKSRMLMTILGIAGSTGLILTGFGISDSIRDIPDIQYEEVNQFQAYVALNPSIDSDELEEYRNVSQDIDSIEEDLFVSQEEVRVEREGMNTQDMTFFVPENSNNLNEFVRLSDPDDETKIYDLDDSGAYITEKIARLLDLKPGDQFEVLNSDDEIWTVDVAGIVENYIGHLAYMTPDYYSEVTGKNFDEPDVQLIKYDDDKVNTSDLGGLLIEEDGVVGIQYVTDIYEAFAGTLDSLDLITQILVISAAALAFIVLYNLTNINVSERSRELSTIKVLGSHDYEVTTYIYRENIILTLLGILVGLGFGNLLTNFIMGTMEIDMLVFGRNIYLSSYIYSSLLTIVFSLVVMVVIHFQLKRIDMVEALKGND